MVKFFTHDEFKDKIREGTLFGIALIEGFTFRFLIEFFKENQEHFEKDLPFNMGQLLSIPLVLLGVLLILNVYGKLPFARRISSTRKK